ncbi:helix-turn-helix domain-containing protein [Brachybacterium alimentarium]|uniref:helix-turn-helix domain-containing protein n=1 Tax=Brachybacterium alimentarium TaxID=47845 RepID=UPI003FD5D28A
MTREQDYLTAVGQQLRAEIAAAGTSAKKISEKISMDRTTLHRYLHGQRDIPLSALVRIAGGIGVDPAVVLDRAEERAGSDSEVVGDAQ